MAGGDGMEGDVVARAQVQAHAAASAAVVPVQAHLERELSLVRRRAAALRSGGSFESIKPVMSMKRSHLRDRPSY